MNQLPGNPHAARAISARDNAYKPDQSLEKKAVSAHIAQATATLAVAYELRTQTLVSLHQMAMTAIGAAPLGGVPEEMVTAMQERTSEIEERLGGTK